MSGGRRDMMVEAGSIMKSRKESVNFMLLLTV